MLHMLSFEVKLILRVSSPLSSFGFVLVRVSKLSVLCFVTIPS